MSKLERIAIDKIITEIAEKENVSKKQLLEKKIGVRKHHYYEFIKHGNRKNVGKIVKEWVENYGKDQNDAEDLEELEQKTEFEIKEEKLKHQIKELKEANKILKKRITNQERFREFLQANIEEYMSVPNPPKMKIKKDPKKPVMAMNIVFSDWHLGEVVEYIAMGGRNEFNIKIALNRLWYFVEQSLDILETMRKSYQIDILYVDFLGDTIGNIIHEELMYSSELLSAKSSILAAEIISQILSIYAEHFNEIHAYFVTGNHDRVTKKLHFKKKYESFQLIIAESVRARVSNIEHVQIHNLYSIYNIVEKLGWKFSLGHGDSIKSWGGIPFYGIDRAVKNELANTKNGFHYKEIGHFHMAGELPVAGVKVLINGSLKGGDEFSMSKFHSVEPPSQKIFLISEKHGLSWLLNVDLRPADHHEFNISY